MDKGTIITASRNGPDLSMASPPRVASHLAPTLAYIIRVQNVLSSISLFLCFRAYFLASATLYAGKIVGFQTYWMTKVGAVVSGHIVYNVWESYLMQQIRKRVFFEFATFILGGGNGLILMLFWPGWWLIAGSACAAWYLMT